MPWVRFDDRFPSNRKISLLSDRAFRLYVSAVCWSAENLTDGVILDEELTLVAHVRNINGARNELESRGLWERIEGGWRIHDYHDYQPTRHRVMEDRRRNAARQEAFRERKRAKQDAAAPATPPPSNAGSNDVTNGVSHGGSNNVPSRPDPVLPTEVQGDSARGHTERLAESPAADADKPRGTPKNPAKHETADKLAAAFWEHHKQRTAQSFIAIRGIVRTALANGLDRDDVARALDHLAREGRAISGGTLTTALGQLRQPVQGAFLTAIPGGAARSTTDERVAQGLALAAQLRAEEQQAQEKHA